MEQRKTTIIRGQNDLARRHAARISRGEEGWIFTLGDDSNFLPPWAGARRLLALLRAQIGDDAVEDALAQHRAVLSLVLRKLASRLTPKEREERDQISPLHRGFLPNAVLTEASSRALTVAWSKVFLRLLADRRSVLVIPDITMIDAETMTLVRPLLRGCRIPDCGLRFIFGCDPEFRPGDNLSAINVQTVAKELSLLELLPDTVVVSADQTDAGQTKQDGGQAEHVPTDPLDDQLEQSAWEALRASTEVPSPSTCELAFQAIRSSFGSFSMRSVLVLTRELFERLPAMAIPPDIHAIAAISASGYCSFAGQSSELLKMAEQHFLFALAASTEARQRVYLLYRLCLFTAHRRGGLTVALQLATRAFEQAQTLSSEWAAYYEAWSRNARAYVNFRLGKQQEASHDCECALDRLRETGCSPRVPAAEIAITRYHLLNNLARLWYEVGDRAQAKHWQRLCEECETEIPANRRPGYSWLSVHLADDNLEAAIGRCKLRLAEAQEEVNPRLEALCAHSLGELEYRVGRAEEAYRHFQVTRCIWRALKDFPEDVFTAELNCAVTAFRAGLLEQSGKHFDSLLASGLSEDERAELQGALAMVVARRGDHSRAEELISQAMAHAQTCGKQDVLVRVARSVGEAWSAMGNRPEAREVLELAWLQASSASQDDENCCPAEDVLGVLTSLQECDSDRPELAVQSLLFLPEALDDVNAWWELPRLLPRILLLLQRGILKVEGEEASRSTVAMTRLLQAASQRPDCKVFAKQLRSAIQETYVSLRQ